MKISEKKRGSLKRRQGERRYKKMFLLSTVGLKLKKQPGPGFFKISTRLWPGSSLQHNLLHPNRDKPEPKKLRFYFQALTSYFISSLGAHQKFSFHSAQNLTNKGLTTS